MKRTQKSVILGLLALSLAACSYFPWKNTSGSSPAALPSASGNSATVPSASTTTGSAGTTSARNNTGTSEPTGQN
ncbi:MAG: hypothetical protein JWQ01_2110 [Massilia sp.]|nr:hypothetical protein [Massilia sp.]